MRRPRPLTRRVGFLGNPCCGDNSLPLVPSWLRSREGKVGESEVPRGAIYWLLRVPTCDVRDTVARRDAGKMSLKFVRGH